MTAILPAAAHHQSVPLTQHVPQDLRRRDHRPLLLAVSTAHALQPLPQMLAPALNSSGFNPELSYAWSLSLEIGPAGLVVACRRRCHLHRRAEIPPDPPVAATQRTIWDTRHRLVEIVVHRLPNRPTWPDRRAVDPLVVQHRLMPEHHRPC